LEHAGLSESVTVTVYVPAARFNKDDPVPELLHEKVYGCIPPVTVNEIDPLFWLQAVFTTVP